MYKTVISKKFEKDFARCLKRKYNFQELEKVLSILENAGKLPQKYSPHKLSGKNSGLWECHIRQDWILIWDQDDEMKILYLVAMGTYSDLF